MRNVQVFDVDAGADDALFWPEGSRPLADPPELGVLPPSRALVPVPHWTLCRLLAVPPNLWPRGDELLRSDWLKAIVNARDAEARRRFAEWQRRMAAAFVAAHGI